MNWYMIPFKKYADFTGRAQRSEYWYFVLFNTLISFGLSLIDFTIGTGDPSTGMGLFSGLFSLAILIPSISVGARRLHDTDRSGWWMLLALIPVIGVIVLIVLFALDSQPNANRFGANPKTATEAL